VQRALPNSVRIDATGTYIEFLPVSTGGRYRAAPSAAGAGDFLDFSSTTDGSFDVLGPPVTVLAGDQLVVYNLGIPGADVYNGDTRRALTSIGAALAGLSYTVGGTQFPYASPSSRFQVVSTPVSYGCSPTSAGGSGQLRRYTGYAIQAAQPANGAAPPLAALAGANNALLGNVVSECLFRYAAAASARNALLTVRLTLQSGGESVTLLQQIHLDNAP